MITKEQYFELKDRRLKRAEIAKVLGLSESQLKKLITNNGWGIKQVSYTYNGCFDELNEYSAYWLGFLFADGSVTDKGGVRLTLQASDIEHVKKFQKFVGAEHYKLQQPESYNRVALEFTSPEMCVLLAPYGIVPRKTLTSTPLPPIHFGPYFKDFLRGFFDGDGTICESFSNKNSITATLYTGFAVARQNMEWLDNVLTNVIKVSYKSFEKPNMFTITLNTNKSIALLKYMYEDSEIYLNRKFELYMKTVVLNQRETR